MEFGLDLVPDQRAGEVAPPARTDVQQRQGSLLLRATAAARVQDAGCGRPAVSPATATLAPPLAVPGRRGRLGLTV